MSLYWAIHVNILMVDLSLQATLIFLYLVDCLSLDYEIVSVQQFVFPRKFIHIQLNPKYFLAFTGSRYFPYWYDIFRCQKVMTYSFSGVVNAGGLNVEESVKTQIAGMQWYLHEESPAKNKYRQRFSATGTGAADITPFCLKT